MCFNNRETWYSNVLPFFGGQLTELMYERMERIFFTLKAILSHWLCGRWRVGYWAYVGPFDLIYLTGAQMLPLQKGIIFIYPNSFSQNRLDLLSPREARGCGCQNGSIFEWSFIIHFSKNYIANWYGYISGWGEVQKTFKVLII